jgi:hypothetical protein
LILDDPGARTASEMTIGQWDPYRCVTNDLLIGFRV